MQCHASGDRSPAILPGTEDTERPANRSNRAEEILRRTPIHPVLIAAFPILSLYAHNIAEVPLQEIWRPLGISLVGCLGLWALVALLTSHARKAAIAASAVSLVFFSFGHIANLLPDNSRGSAGPICVVGLAALMAMLVRYRGSLTQVTVVANLAALVLAVPSCLTVGSWLITRAWNTSRFTPARTRPGDGRPVGPRAGRNERIAVVPPAVAATAPDIYYIILDAYGGADSLKEFYGYDNTPFISALEQRGFYVPRHSRANYAQTSYCLPASLNMRYLDSLLSAKGPAEDGFETLRRHIDDNAVAEYLRGRGYRYVSVWTGTAITRVETADVILDNHSSVPTTSFAGQVWGLSALGSAPPNPQMAVGIARDYDRHRAFIRSAFENLDSVPELPNPKFVFAHILAPHPPFVFGPNGEPVNPPYPYNDADGSELLNMHKIDKQQYKSLYIGQLRYINGRVLEAVDSIVRRSSRPPIIIVQGDHGSRMNVDWDSQAKTDLREPFSILNAYLVPARVRRRLYDTITPVNSFRVLLSELFEADYPLLPDRSYFATFGQPLRFTEVTHLIPEFSPGTARPGPDVSPTRAHHQRAQ
jgi:hypothetical protein